MSQKVIHYNLDEIDKKGALINLIYGERSNEKLLFDELYEKTKDCGRVQFVKLLMTKEKENQELKLELSGYRQAILEDKDMLGLKEESEELKKQLTTYKILHRDCKVDNLKNISKIEEMENQQKEFIEYMTKTIEELECDDVDDEEMKGYLIQRIDTFKEILLKYKEII